MPPQVQPIASGEIGGEEKWNMSPLWLRWRRRCVLLSSGGVTLGILQGLGMVNWAQLFTQLLTQWLTALVAWLLGGQTSTSLTDALGGLSSLLNLL